MRKLIGNKNGAIEYIQMGIIILVMAALAVPITLAFSASFNADIADYNYQMMVGNASTAAHKTPMSNVSAGVIATSGTVLSLNPLAALVAVAAGMISLLAGAFFVGSRGGSGI